MFSRIFNALTLVRHAVAIALVTGAVTTMVAGSLEVASAQSVSNTTANSAITTTASTKSSTTGELEDLVKACLATKDPQSTVCAQAIDTSGKDAPAFWSSLAMSLQEQLKRASSEKVTSTAKPEPTNTPEATEPAHPVVTGDLLYLVAACVESHERTGAACQKALETSGLTAAEFYAKVEARFGRTTEPTTKPTETTKPADRASREGLSILIHDCLATYEYARYTSNGGTAASQACKKAIDRSGLSADDFWARFGPKTTKTTEPTRRPEPTRKPEPSSPTAVPTASDEQLAAMVKDCFAKYQLAKERPEAGAAAYEACTKAINSSGLMGDSFWKKFGLPGATSN